MKKIILIISTIFLFNSICFSQNRTLPSINVQTTDGNSINIKDIENSNNPIVISFWAIWCKPCIKELNNIAEVYEEWQDETGVKLIAISIDDSRSMSKVSPFINASDWEYEVYLDPNGDLKRAMGVSTVPHTFLLNKNREIVWQHKGYVDGDEYDLYEEIQKISE